jgi:hypothetical protein
MSIILNDLVKKQDIVDRFNTRVRDLVTASTDWVAGTGVWNTDVGTVIANSTAYGGGYNRGTYADAIAPAVSTADLVPIVGAQTSVVGHVTNVLKSFMSVYANTHRVVLNNTGNLAPASYNGTVRLDGAPGADVSAIQSDFDSSAASFNVLNGQLITATNLNNLIEACRTIWTNRAYNPVLENYYYSYCHSSCHSSAPPCHGSRGRR